MLKTESYDFNALPQRVTPHMKLLYKCAEWHASEASDCADIFVIAKQANVLSYFC